MKQPKVNSTTRIAIDEQYNMKKGDKVNDNNING